MVGVLLQNTQVNTCNKGIHLLLIQDFILAAYIKDLCHSLLLYIFAKLRRKSSVSNTRYDTLTSFLKFGVHGLI